MSGRRTPGRMADMLRLERVLAASLAVLAAPAALVTAGPAAAQPVQFRAPHAPVVLTRELRRSLADGQQLVVRRRYLVRFAATPTGWLVTADPLGAEVEAPAALAEMAEVERQRADTGLFPLELDHAGLIVARPAPTESVDAARARTAMAAYLARTDLSEEDRARARAMALRLQAQFQAAGNSWPADLFRPAPGTRSEHRDMPLPDGRSGKVTITIDAAETSGGLLDRFERRVVTEVEGTHRLTVERWTLAAAP